MHATTLRQKAPSPKNQVPSPKSQDTSVETKQISNIEHRISNDEAEAHFLEIQEYLRVSRNNINRLNKIKKAITVTISALLVATAIALVWAIGLKRDIERISHSNGIATQAFITLEKDPTLAFRLAEQAYNIVPTPLAKQVIMAAYGEMPFYKKLVGHKEGCRPAKYSPDGNFIVSGSTNGEIKLWNKKGKFSVDLKGHTAKIPNSNESINFSNDGKYIVSCSQDSTARLWNLEGKCLAVIKHKGAVNSVCFSPVSNPQTLSGSANSDRSSQPQTTNDKRQTPARFAAGGSNFKLETSNFLILTASSDKTLRLSDMQGKQIVEIKLDKPVSKAIFSPDGKTIAAIVGKTAKLFDLNGKEIKEFKEHKYGISDFGFSENGEYFYTGAYDSVAIIRNLKDSKLLYLKHNLIVQKVKFSSDNKYIVTTTSDNSIHLWNLKGKELSVMRKHIALIWDIKFSPNNKYIISASDDGTARLWDINGTELMVFKGHTDQVLSANFSPDGKHVVTASADKTARIWNIEPLENPIFKGHRDVVMDANFSPDGKYIATAAWDYTARLWEFGGKLVSVLKGHARYALNNSIFFNHENKLISCADASGGIVIWNYKGDTIKKIKTFGHYYSLTISKNDKFIFWGDENKAILFDSTGKKLQVFKEVAAAGFAAQNPEYIYTIAMDSSLCLWRKAEAPSPKLKAPSSKSQASSPKSRVSSPKEETNLQKSVQSAGDTSKHQTSNIKQKNNRTKTQSPTNSSTKSA
ncbi:MAG: WD40 repeat domain-containing protein [Bacteroidetes bacterium]|nr:WD40 repeat domain-containing protein [Bacteroidota bacterium]